MYKFLTETKQNSPQINMMNMMKLTNLGNGTIAVSGDFLPVWDALKSLEGWTWSENELVFNDVPVRIRQLEQKNVELERDNKAKAKSTIENDTLRKENESLKRTIQLAQIEITYLKKENDALKTRSTALEHEIDALKGVHTARSSKNEVADLKTKIATLERMMAMAEIEVSDRDDHIDHLKNENDELKDVIEAMKTKPPATKSPLQQWKIENDWKTDGEIDAMKTKAIAENDMVAIMEACKEEARMEILKTKMPRAEKVVGGNATTKKTNEGQKAKHMRFYEEKGGQWIVDNIKCHFCPRCYGSKAVRDNHHLEKHAGETPKTKWTTAGDAEWVKTFGRS
jgi:FtsZ-binding cell division protein ZapB